MGTRGKSPEFLTVIYGFQVSLITWGLMETFGD